MKKILGVIGGSGLYNMPALKNVREEAVTTTFGQPSDKVIIGNIGDTELLFIPRHGRTHWVPPHQVNYRANILALKQLGAQQVVSVSAVGSMKEEIVPGDVVLVDQFVDRTRSRSNTFFEDVGVAAHVEFADPICLALSEALYQSALAVEARAHKGGTYVCIEGPQFSTRAESNLFRSWGVSVIGMTNLPEARLAREAELPYATVALATDYDCWHQGEAAVTVEAVVAVLKKNVQKAQSIIEHVSANLPDPNESPATTALKHAIMTRPESISKEAKAKLSVLVSKYL